MDGVLLILRPLPRPRLAIIGHFNEAQAAHLEAQAGHVQWLCQNLRFVSYSQVEKDCQALATQLQERWGEDVKSFRFSAMPRGGMVVLGMLAYCLGLERHRLEPPFPVDAPLVVVDDCALTGARFASYLERQASQQVIFTPLYAPQGLREAILKEEPRVIACLSAQDINGVVGGEETNQQRLARWRPRLDGKRYWVGAPEHVCFPWNEPDTFFWNPVSEKVEKGWRILPGELCLKNRLPPGVQPVALQVQPEGKGPFRPTEAVIFGEYERQIVIGQLESGQTFGLEGTAAAMWRALLEAGSLEEAVDRMVREYAVEEGILRADLQAFIDDLLGRGILERCLD